MGMRLPPDLEAKCLEMATPKQPKPRRNKYGNEAVTVDGLKFHSRREAKRYRELRVMQRAGQITGLRLQVSFKLIKH